MDYDYCCDCGHELDDDGYCAHCDLYPFGPDWDDLREDDDYIFGCMDAVEADADALRSMGWGTDEDYGYNGEDYMNDWEGEGY